MRLIAIRCDLSAHSIRIVAFLIALKRKRTRRRKISFPKFIATVATNLVEYIWTWRWRHMHLGRNRHPVLLLYASIRNPESKATRRIIFREDGQRRISALFGESEMIKED